MKPGELLNTLVLETEREILVARDAADARSDASIKLSTKLRDAEAPFELEPNESRFVLHSLRVVRDHVVFREIEKDAVTMINDYQQAYIERTGAYPKIPELGESVRPY